MNKHYCIEYSTCEDMHDKEAVVLPKEDNHHHHRASPNPTPTHSPSKPADSVPPVKQGHCDSPRSISDFHDIDEETMFTLPESLATTQPGSGSSSSSLSHKKRTQQRSSSPAAKTLEVLESSLELRRHRYGPRHAKVAQVWNCMGEHFLQMAERDSTALGRALDCYRRAFQFGKCTESAEALSNIGAIHLKRGDVHTAICCSEKALTQLQSIQGRQEFFTARKNAPKARILIQLGLAYLASEDASHHRHARDCLFRCLNLRVVTFGPNHALVGSAYKALGKYCMAMNQWDQAKKYQVRALSIFSTKGACIRAVATLHDLVETSVLGKDAMSAKLYLKKRQRLLEQPRVQRVYWNCPGLLESAMEKTEDLIAQVESMETLTLATHAPEYSNTHKVDNAPAGSGRTYYHSFKRFGAATQSSSLAPVPPLRHEPPSRGGFKGMKSSVRMTAMKRSFSRYNTIPALPEEEEP